MSARTLILRAVTLAVGAVASLSLVQQPADATHAGVQPQLTKPRIVGSACSSDDGVTVAVDFRNLQNQHGHRMNLIRIGCAEQPVGDGFDALLGAGFDVDSSQPFVCTIDERPIDPGSCPPPDGFWSYTHGTRGVQKWQLSGVGAGDWHPPAGSLEGWSWSPYGHIPSWSHPRISGKDLFPHRTTGR